MLGNINHPRSQEWNTLLCHLPFSEGNPKPAPGKVALDHINSLQTFQYKRTSAAEGRGKELF